jgi:hypothetical protein
MAQARNHPWHRPGITHGTGPEPTMARADRRHPPTASADGRYSFERARALDMRLLAKLWSQLRALLSDPEAAPAGGARPQKGKASGGAAEAAAAAKWRACVPYLVVGAAAAPIEVLPARACRALRHVSNAAAAHRRSAPPTHTSAGALADLCSHRTEARTALHSHRPVAFRAEP